MSAYTERRLYGCAFMSDTEPKDARLRIPDYVLETVCFIAIKTAQGFQNIGTGFFVEMADRNGNRFTYVVTAKHCVTGPRLKGMGDVYIRVNSINGPPVSIQIDQWEFSADKGVDMAVAMLPVDYWKNGFLQIRCLPVEMFANENVVENRGLGVGDETFMLGLFHYYWGSDHEELQPVARFGNIAVMPKYKFHRPESHLSLYDLEGEYQAYLVEIRSIGGLSGSPVMCLTDKQHYEALGREWPSENKSSYGIFLLGLMSGHWDFESNLSADSVVFNARDSIVNSGMAYVTPIHRLREIVNSEVSYENRVAAAQKYNERLAPSMDLIPNPDITGR